MNASLLVRPGRHRTLAAALVVLLLAGWAFASLRLGPSADADARERCARFAETSRARAAILTGEGRAVTVLGDSYSVGLGLARPRVSWPSRLDGRVRVLGFSGSGFSAQASPCRRSSFAARASAGPLGDGIVVVEGGLNDFDQPRAAIEAGLARVLRAAGDRPVLIVGPASAPSRAGAVPRVDRILRAAATRAGVPYLSMRGVRFPYLADRLHLTAAGHRQFGDLVAKRIAALGL